VHRSDRDADGDREPRPAGERPPGAVGGVLAGAWSRGGDDRCHVPARSASGAVDRSACPHLDVNGDGYDDLVIGAWNADPGDRANAGTVSVFLGSAAGVGATAATELAGASVGDQMGASVAAAGDVDGDGYGDLAVGASYTSVGEHPNAGSVSVFLGGPAGLAERAHRTLEGTGTFDIFGATLAGAGDLNGDGYADLAVGAPLADPGNRVDAGSVSVFLGGAAGTAAVAAVVLGGVAAGDLFGQSVSGGGDLNGDGYSDLVVGAILASPGGRGHAGTESVYLGGASGVGPTAATVLEGDNGDDQFGGASAMAGDVNGDGYTDLVVGSFAASPGRRARAGRASVFHGDGSGVASLPAVVLEGLFANDLFGNAVAGAGDVNGDGYADVIVSATLADPGNRVDAGTVSVFHGSDEGIMATPARVLAGVGSTDEFGHFLTGAGDLNRDGFADIAVTAWNADPEGRPDAGAASMFLGSAAGVPTVPSRVFQGAAAGDRFGSSVASAATPDGRPRAASAHDDAGAGREAEAQCPAATLEQGRRVDALVGEVLAQPIEQGVEVDAALGLARPDPRAEHLFGNELARREGWGWLQQRGDQVTPPVRERHREEQTADLDGELSAAGQELQHGHHGVLRPRRLARRRVEVRRPRAHMERRRAVGDQRVGREVERLADHQGAPAPDAWAQRREGQSPGARRERAHGGLPVADAEVVAGPAADAEDRPDDVVQRSRGEFDAPRRPAARAVVRELALAEPRERPALDPVEAHGLTAERQHLDALLAHPHQQVVPADLGLFEDDVAVGAAADEHGPGADHHPGVRRVEPEAPFQPWGSETRLRRSLMVHGPSQHERTGPHNPSTGRA
jgi:hypothetical protein